MFYSLQHRSMYNVGPTVVHRLHYGALSVKMIM